MIKIQKEPKEYFKEFRVYEHCYFCQKQTDTWNIEHNKPVCVDCSTKYDTKNLITLKNK